MERELIKLQDPTWTRTNEMQYRAIAAVIGGAALYALVAGMNLAASAPIQLAASAVGASLK